MFGRKKPEAKTVDSNTESERTTSYRISQDAAPATTGVNRTTSYVNAMQRDGRGYETIN
ncbi:MAG TPA: hypothetical protein VFW64_03265 [Pseudonocardiaceae bacterium]|nr:hypothetical protein [Pseudonocardiaceae bacterium]